MSHWLDDLARRAAGGRLSRRDAVGRAVSARLPDPPSGERIDRAARALATPMPRRQMLALTAGAAAATALVRVPSARAQQGCPAGTTFCPNGGVATEPGQCCGSFGDLDSVCCNTGSGSACCAKGQSCCIGPNGVSQCCGCPSPDTPCGTLADGTARNCCGPGFVCKNPATGSCGCADPCGSSGICCTADQICDKSRGTCCPPDPDAPKCNAPEPRCKKEVDERIESQVDDCGGAGDAVSNSAAAMSDDGLQILSCSFAANVITKSYEYDRCAQVPSNATCGGGRCNPQTLRCSRCADTSASATRAAAASSPPADAYVPAPPDGHSAAARVTKAVLRRRLRRSRRRVGRAYAKMLREVRAPVEVALPRPALARAIGSYRTEIIRLRKTLARGSGGPPQRLALTALDETAAGLAAYRRAARATTTNRAAAEARRGRRRFRRGATATRRTRKALGCGKRCL